MINLICSQAFSAGQIVIFILLGLLEAGIVAVHVYLAYCCNKEAAEYEAGKTFRPEKKAQEPEKPAPEPEPIVEPEPEPVPDDDDEEEEAPVNEYGITPEMEAEAAVVVPEEERAFVKNLRILPVADMTEKMRGDFALSGEEYDGKRYYARFSYSFDAKLHCAKELTKEFYGAILNELSAYKKTRVKGSGRQQRITAGRTTLGLILFKGKTLCVALALNPADYVEGKIRGEDMSEKKRFEQTPVLFRISSARKLKFVTELLKQLAETNGLQTGANPSLNKDIRLTAMTDGELYDNGLLKIRLKGEVPPTVQS